MDIISKVMSVAKIVGLNVLVEAPAPVDGVWAGISQSQQPVSVPVAGNYLQGQGPAIWPLPLTKGVNQGSGGCLVSSPDVRDKNPLFGRQTDLCSISHPSRRGHRESDLTYTVLGFQGECKEK